MKCKAKNCKEKAVAWFDKKPLCSKHFYRMKYKKQSKDPFWANMKI